MKTAPAGDLAFETVGVGIAGEIKSKLLWPFSQKQPFGSGSQAQATKPITIKDPDQLIPL